MFPAVPSLQNPHFCDHGDLLADDFWEMSILHAPAAGPALRNFYGFKYSLMWLKQSHAGGVANRSEQFS